jgi:hypothetical protein
MTSPLLFIPLLASAEDFEGAAGAEDFEGTAAADEAGALSALPLVPVLAQPVKAAAKTVNINKERMYFPLDEKSILEYVDSAFATSFPASVADKAIKSCRAAAY